MVVLVSFFVVFISFFPPTSLEEVEDSQEVASIEVGLLINERSRLCGKENRFRCIMSVWSMPSKLCWYLLMYWHKVRYFWFVWSSMPCLNWKFVSLYHFPLPPLFTFTIYHGFSATPQDLRRASPIRSSSSNVTCNPFLSSIPPPLRRPTFLFPKFLTLVERCFLESRWDLVIFGF